MSTFIKAIVIFGHIPSDLKNIRSSISFSYDRYRKQFKEFMEKIDDFRRVTLSIDSTNEVFGGIHKELRINFELIPLAFEKNERM